MNIKQPRGPNLSRVIVFLRAGTRKSRRANSGNRDCVGDDMKGSVELVQLLPC